MGGWERAYWHTPLRQRWFWAQVAPQPPQLVRSVSGSTQPPHAISPDGQPHWPPVQTRLIPVPSVPHIVPQLPQLAESLEVSTQTPPPHGVSPPQSNTPPTVATGGCTTRRWHALLTQFATTEHGLAQPPQLA